MAKRESESQQPADAGTSAMAWAKARGISAIVLGLEGAASAATMCEAPLLRKEG